MVFVPCMCKVTVFFVSFQHLQDMLELDMSALAFMMKCFPEIKEVEDMRKAIGRYGLTGKQQVSGKLVVSSKLSSYRLMDNHITLAFNNYYFYNGEIISATCCVLHTFTCIHHKKSFQNYISGK